MKSRKLYCCCIFFFITSIQGLAQAPQLVLPIGHKGFVNTAAYSPDGKKIITASEDKTAKLWDAATGLLLADLKGHAGGVTGAAFSRDGTKLLTVSGNGNIRIWNPVTASLLQTIQTSTSAANAGSAHFSPDGQKIVTAFFTESAKLWEVTTGKLIAELKIPAGKITCAGFSPDGTKIVTGSDDNTALIWDAVTASIITLLKGHTDDVKSVLFSPDGTKIATTSFADDTVKIWDVTTGALIYNLAHDFRVSSAAFNADGTKMVTASQDKTAKAWDIKTGQLLLELVGHVWGVQSAQFSADGKKIITASADHSARIWDGLTGALLIELKGHRSPVKDATFSPDGKTVLTASSDNTAKTWNSITGIVSGNLKGHSTTLIGAAISTNEKKIVTYGEDKAAKAWNLTTGSPGRSLASDKQVIGTIVSDDGKKVATIYSGYSVRVSDAENGLLITELKMQWSPVDHPSLFQFSKDGNKILSICNTVIFTWDAVSGILVRQIKGHQSFIHSAQFSPDGLRILTSSADSTAKVWDAGTGKLLLQLKHAASVEQAVFNTDGTKIATACSDKTAKLWDAANGKLLLELKGHRSYVQSVAFSKDGKQLLTSSYDNTVRTWDAVTGAFIKEIYVGKVSTAAFNSDAKKIVTTWDHDLITTGSLWDAATKNNMQNFSASDGVQNIQFNNGGNKIVVMNADNTCQVWNAGNGKLSYTFFPVDTSGYISQIPTGYYHATPGAAKLLHYVTAQLQPITFEQLDVKYNRPDKVLEAMGSTDTALIKSYRKAYEKRIKKLGIDTSSFRDGYSVPIADIINREEIAAGENREQLEVHIKASDSTYYLDRFNIWINEIPIFGQRGCNVKKKNSNSLDTLITIRLLQGVNNIEVSVINTNGTESYRMPLIINYTPVAETKGMTHFIGIGIDKFADSKNNLQFSSKDIRDLSLKLKERYKGAIIIDTLFDENVTVANVKALKNKLQQTAANDKVIIAYSGHGMLGKEYDYYLSTYAVNFEKPEGQGLPYDELENLLDSIPARKKLLLIDACHSGEVDKEELIRVNETPDSLIKGLKPVAYAKEGQLGLTNSIELMQSLFVNVGKNTGATIISAAGGTQFALERNDLKNGVFTYSILEAMNKYPVILLSELKKIVSQQVEQLTDGRQKPTSRNETIAVDWQL